jgi:hypothetical protein
MTSPRHQAQGQSLACRKHDQPAMPPRIAGCFRLEFSVFGFQFSVVGRTWWMIRPFIETSIVYEAQQKGPVFEGPGVLHDFLTEN